MINLYFFDFDNEEKNKYFSEMPSVYFDDFSFERFAKICEDFFINRLGENKLFTGKAEVIEEYAFFEEKYFNTFEELFRKEMFDYIVKEDNIEEYFKANSDIRKKVKELGGTEDDVNDLTYNMYYLTEKEFRDELKEIYREVFYEVNPDKKDFFTEVKEENKNIYKFEGKPLNELMPLWFELGKTGMTQEFLKREEARLERFKKKDKENGKKEEKIEKNEYYFL